VKRVLIIAFVSLSILYIGDYISIRYRVAKNRTPFGVVTVQTYYAVPQKNRKTEFYFDQPQNQSCIHSLFPHFGYSPCWYLNRKRVKQINM
jgi:hypothetical protein